MTTRAVCPPSLTQSYEVTGRTAATVTGVCLQRLQNFLQHLNLFYALCFWHPSFFLNPSRIYLYHQLVYIPSVASSFLICFLKTSTIPQSGEEIFVCLLHTLFDLLDFNTSYLGVCLSLDIHWRPSVCRTLCTAVWWSQRWRAERQWLERPREGNTGWQGTPLQTWGVKGGVKKDS